MTMIVPLAIAATLVQQSGAHPPAELLGTWRGTSLCTDRVAAPACNDETVVYEFTPGATPGVVHWAADKIVDGKRVPMGELDASFDAAERCWKAEFTGPRETIVWRITVEGVHLTGTGTVRASQAKVRKMDLRKDPAGGRR